MSKHFFLKNYMFVTYVKITNAIPHPASKKMETKWWAPSLMGMGMNKEKKSGETNNRSPSINLEEFNLTTLIHWKHAVKPP